MTRTGQAVVTVGKEFSIGEYTVPDPAPGTVLLRQELGGICGTDLHNWQKGIKRATMLGHENVGVIEALGKGVTTDYNGTPIREGDRVVFHPRNTVMASGHGAAGEPFSGGFADYIYLSDPASCIIRSEAPPQVGVFAEPFTIGVHAALRGGVKIGDTVIVQGAGPIGMMCLIAAKISGAGRLIVIGGPAGRLQLARKLGAHETIDIMAVPDADERREMALKMTPGRAGAEVVMEVAGFLPAFPEGLELVKEDGVFVEVGHYVDVGTIAVSPHRHFLRPNLRLEGVRGSQFNHFVRAVAVMESAEVDFASVISHILPLERVQEGFDALDNGYMLDGKTAFKIAVRGAFGAY